MNREELFDLLDISSGDEFTYFENFASLMEMDEYIEEAEIALLLRELDYITFSELAESYFYDVMENLPDNAIDIYNTMEAVKRNIVSFSSAIEKGEDKVNKLCHEIFNFRNWYDNSMNCTVIDLASGKERHISIKEAIYENRIAKLEKRDLDFDFSEAEQMEINEFIVNLGELS
ncbi:MAG: hypothetical protein SPI74_04065 [Eubacterium sp.]|nr:hypothetical protein [Eubacterium sp.]